MTGSALIYTVFWLIRDTFRQARATRIFWIMLGITAACTLFCLGVGVEGGLAEPDPHSRELFTRDNQPVTDNSQGEVKMTMLFGLFSAPFPRFAADAVHFLEIVLGTLVAGSLGLLMALVWTAGFVPEFLQPSVASVLFAKPAPRWALLLGKYLGVVLFMSFQIGVFFTCTWIALGLKTGVWPYSYLAGIPLMIIHFMVIYSFSLVLAVLTRSTVVCIFGTVLFWLVCWGANYGRHALVALPVLSDGQMEAPLVSGVLADMTYWVLPKPADIVMLQQQAFQADSHFISLSRMPEFSAMIQAGQFSPGLSLMASLLFSVVMLVIASRHLAQTDY